MMKTRVLTFLSLLLFASSLFAADPSLPELFKRAKEKFAAADYKGSLADFELLDSISSRTGFENDRAKLLPVITFYRGANLAALGRKAEAKEAFATYLGLIPTAAIASPPYPKTTVDLFEQARREAATRSTTMSGNYAAFAIPGGWKLDADEHWIESPVRYLLTPAQKKEYATFTSNAERATFIEAFWKQLDPTPATGVNEFRNELERRVAFADAMFATEKLAGRYTDRAAIFTFLGPPTYASMGNIGTSDDAMSALRANGNADLDQGTRSSNSTNATGIAAVSGARREDNLDQAYNRGTRESWIYRRDRIPKSIAFQEVRFDFLTKPGYGSGVLQKDPQQMQTLGQAAEIARAAKQLN
jgi:GWxTD domain-containing protein